MEENLKQLLLIDLCSRLPYEVKVHIKGEYKTPRKIYTIYKEDKTITYFKGLDCFEENIENVKPYLRPLSSMTKEEKTLMAAICLKNAIGNVEWAVSELSDFYNSRHFDYRGLIPMGLALEAPKDMYKTE